MTEIMQESLDPSFSMGSNLILALVPLLLALLLFRERVRHTAGWWLGVVLFVAFLPNAPYVLTDGTHLIGKIRSTPPIPDWSLCLFTIPQFFLFMLAGIQAYVLSLLLLGNDMKRRGMGKSVLTVEIMLHALSALGMYLGRVVRLNTWDMWQNPSLVIQESVATVENEDAWTTLAIYFALLFLLYTTQKLLLTTVADQLKKGE